MESCGAESAAVQRLIFAANYLPPDLPDYWNIVANFASSKNVTSQSAKIAMENLKVIDPEAFISDTLIIKEISGVECIATKKPLGIPLVPNQTCCICCGGKLLLRSDRPSRISLYTNTLGTVPATHFHKYCQNNRNGCRLVQYYGYHTNGNTNSQYSPNWNILPYFISSQETGFEMELLKQFDIELLIGQIAYKQKADIYNVVKGYDTVQKRSSTKEIGKTGHKPPVHG